MVCTINCMAWGGCLHTLASAFTVAGRRARVFAASTLFCILQYCTKQIEYSSKTTLNTLHFNKQTPNYLYKIIAANKNGVTSIIIQKPTVFLSEKYKLRLKYTQTYVQD